MSTLRGTDRVYAALTILLLVIMFCSIQLNPLMRDSRDNVETADEAYYVSPSLADEPFIPNHVNETDSKKPPNIPQRFPIEEEDFCKNRPNLDFIVYVHSALSHVEARNNTRMTWANPVTAEKLGVKMGVVYIVGRPKNDKEKQILDMESSLYHDIVQGDFADQYRLLVYKGLAAVEWITRHCNDVPWTIHTDDDVLVNIFLLKKALLERGLTAKDEFLCQMISGVKVLRDGKWAVDVKDLSDEYYPTYCNGPFWALQTRNLKPLLNASQYVNYFWVDDAYLTGYLAKEVGHVGHAWFPNYNYGTNELDELHIGKTILWFSQRGKQMQNWKKVLEHYHRQLKI